MPKTFEKTFSELVENRLQEEAPYLMEYSVGFEIKDKDEDGTKGMGVYAFLINSVPAYIPIVYNKGDIKGFELLWLAKQRLMVPATSGWVDTLKNKSENVFGEIVNNPQVRVRSAKQPEGTMLDSGTFPYAIKTADEDAGNVDGDTIRSMLSSTPEDTVVSGILSEYLQESPAAVASFCKTALEDPDYADAVQKVYKDSGAINKIFERTKQNMQKHAEEEKRTPVEGKGVKVITDISDPDAKLLSNNQKKKLMKTGSFILDSRDDHTDVFTYKTASDILTNPSSPGFCRVLDIEGQLQDAWVGLLKNQKENYAEKVMEKKKITNPSGSQVLVVLRESPETGYKFPYNEVYVSDMNNVDSFEVGTAVKGKDSIPENTVPDSVAVIDHMKDVYEFSTLPSVMEEEDSRSPSEWRMETGCPGSEHNYYVRFTDHNTTGVNVGSRFITIGPAARAVKIKHNSERRAITPGRPEDFNEQIVKNAGMSRLDITCEGPAVTTRLDGKYSGSSNTERELRRIVFDMGVPPSTARDMIKTAQEKGEESYLLKFADAVQSLNTDPDTAVFQVEVPDVKEVENAQESGMLLQKARLTAERAADAGNDDLFEITSLKGLMEVVEDKSLKRDSFVKLMRGMDECGRNLFRLYFKRDEMLQEYGSEDVDKLEDSLKNNFKSLGELVLFLQDKFTSLHSPFQNSMEGLLVQGENEPDAGGIE